MSARPKLLDLFCCAGGAGMGYHRAGFDVVGIDIDPQPRYPFPFFQRDALDFLKIHGKRFDAIHASPPCQAFTNAQRIQKNDHPDFLTPVREMLLELGKPFVIENVVGAPLRDPIMLCGPMFGLETYRHRLFESNIALVAPDHEPHTIRQTKMGRAPVDGEFMQIVGNFSGVERGRQIMGMPWASRNELSEAVPPAMTEYIGRQLLESIVCSEITYAGQKDESHE
jgi:DNA (cytosine-5)-methyltransferase 1